MTKTLKIQPIDLVDLTVTTDEYTYTLADFTVSGDFLVGEIDATIATTRATISSSGYATQSFIYKNLPSEVVLVAREVEILSDGTESYQISDKVARAELLNKADISDIPTKTSDLTNDSDFITSTDLATKVSKSGDSMTGTLTTNSAIYLTNIGNSVHTGVSRLYFGSESSPKNYISANTGGAFGIYDTNKHGVTCYPSTNFFPEHTSGTLDLGRADKKWKDFYISGTLYGANSNITIANLISGASAGATAVQPSSLANVATSGSYNDLSNKPTIPTNNNQLTNGAGYITGISSSDVTTALGYTPADDSKVVKTTGNQTIGGTKTFTSGIVRTTSSQAAQMSLGHQYTTVTKGTSPTSKVNSRWRLYDKDGTGNANTICGIDMDYNKNGSTSISLNAYKPESGSSVNSGISVIYPASGDPYTEAPTPASSDNSTKIATTAYVQAQGYALDSDVVHRTGNETVGGGKTFTSSIYRKTSSLSAQVALGHQYTTATKGMTPTSDVNSRWRLFDKDGTGNANTICGIDMNYNTNGSTSISLNAYKPESSSTTNSGISVTYPATGDPYTSAPTPATGDNSTKIATTAFVHSFFSAISGYDSTQTQTLKNVNGTLTWVTD